VEYRAPWDTLEHLVALPASPRAGVGVSCAHAVEAVLLHLFALNRLAHQQSQISCKGMRTGGLTCMQNMDSEVRRSARGSSLQVWVNSFATRAPHT